MTFWRTAHQPFTIGKANAHLLRPGRGAPNSKHARTTKAVALGISPSAVVGVTFGFLPWVLAAFALATSFVVISGLVSDYSLA